MRPAEDSTHLEARISGGATIGWRRDTESWAKCSRGGRHWPGYSSLGRQPSCSRKGGGRNSPAGKISRTGCTGWRLQVLADPLKGQRELHPTNRRSGGILGRNQLGKLDRAPACSRLELHCGSESTDAAEGKPMGDVDGPSGRHSAGRRRGRTDHGQMGAETLLRRSARRSLHGRRQTQTPGDIAHRFGTLHSPPTAGRAEL